MVGSAGWNLPGSALLSGFAVHCSSSLSALLFKVGCGRVRALLPLDTCTAKLPFLRVSVWHQRFFCILVAISS